VAFVMKDGIFSLYGVSRHLYSILHENAMVFDLKKKIEYCIGEHLLLKIY